MTSSSPDPTGSTHTAPVPRNVQNVILMAAMTAVAISLVALTVLSILTGDPRDGGIFLVSMLMFEVLIAEAAAVVWPWRAPAWWKRLLCLPVHWPQPARLPALASTYAFSLLLCVATALTAVYDAVPWWPFVLIWATGNLARFVTAWRLPSDQLGPEPAE